MLKLPGLVVLASALAGGTEAQSPDDRAWQDFLQWLRTIPAANGPRDVLRGYQTMLAARNPDASSVQQEVGRVLRLMRERQDAWPLLFDKVYASTAPSVSPGPSALLMSATERRPPGRALEVAMGQGRNALGLASRGWQVTGFDVSAEGLAVATAQAAKAGLKLTVVQESDDRFDFGEGQWDLIAVIYGPVSTTDDVFVRRLHRALRQGGLVVVESFASNADAPMRRPVDVDPAELRRAFEPLFRLVRFEDVEDVSEWDPQKTRLARMIAEKK